MAGPSRRNAIVPGVEHYENALRTRTVHQRRAHLDPDSFLHLWARCDGVEHSSDASESDDGVRRCVGDVCDPVKRKEVVFAHRPKREVANNHGIVRHDISG